MKSAKTINLSNNTSLAPGLKFTYLLFLFLVLTFPAELYASIGIKAKFIQPYVKPEVNVVFQNTKSVKKYEKLELHVDLKNVSFKNPYDPADIDLYAEFDTPSGKKIRINGFYDNFKGADQWKIRFSPNETGKYKYQVFVVNSGETGKSPVSEFTAIESDHHGWIRPSEKNLHYFQYDDGTSFYAVGVYSPWRNNQNRFDTYAKYHANLLAIWDITYGGFVNGNGLIEEELGRYNQKKLGMIDSMLSILEKDNVKLMYAIWPHDLFSATVWAAQWKQNPYNKLVDVEDVYSDSLVWKYQKQKYRYLIARFAHSRSWGIWELINEMNGTDGWAKGRHDDCYKWVEKSHQYFKENDPYHHPTTASFSGGFTEYREKLYTLNDIPNIHMYPAQGWPKKYADNKMRSAMYNYAWASRRFWDNFEKPAIFGEAGADLAFYKPKEPEYHVAYHNQIWACLTNGLASTPVWWDYPVLNEQDWNSLMHLSDFVSDIDFANQMYQPENVESDKADIFLMKAGATAFGWLRTINGENAAGIKFSIPNSDNEKFAIEWYDTWTGKTIKSESVSAKNNTLELVVPSQNENQADIAFKIKSL